MAVGHHINTGDAAPIMLRRGREAGAENELIDKEVDTMLAGCDRTWRKTMGFSHSHREEKERKRQLCIAYRALYAVAIKDVYSLPRVNETVEALHGSQWFTSLALRSVYWQLGVAEQDRAKTAFATRRGLFQFKRMPFGLCNAPITFQWLMDCVLRGQTWICCRVNLNDVIIFTKGTVTQHAVELAVVLERLAEAGLSLKATKGSFATTRMEYLGHDLTSEGIRPTDRLVNAIVNFPKPKDEAEVRRFVAPTVYYRRLVPELGRRWPR